MRFVNLDKDFTGKKATVASVDGKLPWICAYLEIEPDGKHDGHGGEAVLMDGKVVGSTASVAFGHTIDRILAFAYIKPEAATAGQALQVVIAGEPRDAVVHDQALYDPDNIKPRTDLNADS